jgi:hypothetical protein
MIESGGPSIAATAWPNPEIERGPFNDVAEPDILIGNKSGKTHRTRLMFSLSRLLIRALVILHVMAVRA